MPIPVPKLEYRDFSDSLIQAWSNVFGVFIGVQESVNLFPLIDPFKLVTFESLLNLSETSVGSEPFLNNSVTFKSAGVYSLGNLAGHVSCSTVTSTTPAGRVQLLPFLNIPFATAWNNFLWLIVYDVFWYCEFAFSYPYHTDIA